MPSFSYIVRDREGKKITGVENASDPEELVASLQEKGFLVISVFPEEGSLKKQRKQFTHKRIKATDLVFFSRQLAVMLGASVPLLRTLETILKQVESLKFHEVLTSVKKDVEGGLSLKDALTRHPQVFNDIWIGLIETGEASGNLPLVLNRLATYLEKQDALKRKFVSALIYPAILLCAAIGALTIFMTVVIPRFSEIFASFDTELPALTQAVMAVSSFMRNYAIWIIMAIVGLVFAFKYILSKPEGRKRFDHFRMKLPLLGEFFKLVEVEQFALQMSILVESGVPIVYALELTERAYKNTVLGESLGHIKNGVRQGKSIGKHLEGEVIFPALLVQMITIGEETGELSMMLKKVSEFYEEVIDNFVARMSVAFEPMIIVFMGGVIGTIVVSMFMPIFAIANLGSGLK